MIKNIKEWQVLTPTGWSDFSGIKQSQHNNSILLTFSNNKKLKCTFRHKIKMKNGHFKYAINLKVNEIIYNKKKLITIKSIKRVKSKNYFYDLLNVDKKNEYFTNGIISHNCAHIDRYKEDEFVKSVMPVISSSNKTKIFMISTPNGTANHFYKIYSGAERGENGWTPEKVDWHEIPGRDEAWRQKATADLGSIEAFNQEYGNMFIETGETAIDKEVIHEFRIMVKKPEIYNTSEYKVWEDADPKSIYIIGADVSDGVGGAASCLQGLNITDLTNIKQAFTYWNKFIDTAHFALEINNIAKQWGRPPILLERNSMGGEVINFLTGQPYNYEHLVGYDGVLQYDKLGIHSSTNVKYEGVSNMRYWVNSLRCLNIFDIATIQELETFVKYPNGTWKKQPGEGILDDRIMALVWALFGLHTPIAESIFEVVQYDDRGKPLKIRKSYYDEDNSFYGLNQYKKNWSDKDFVPAFISTKASHDSNPEMEDLQADGWKLLSDI